MNSNPQLKCVFPPDTGGDTDTRLWLTTETIRTPISVLVNHANRTFSAFPEISLKPDSDSETIPRSRVGILSLPLIPRATGANVLTAVFARVTTSEADKFLCLAVDPNVHKKQHNKRLALLWCFNHHMSRWRNSTGRMESPPLAPCIYPTMTPLWKGSVRK